ncbi:MAG: tal1 [Parachlamydiales bacterium]|nr:tal1 [Parachlamydiales bacterium]
MEIWLETAAPQAAQKADDMGILFGVVTNPTLAGRCEMAFEDQLLAMLNVQKGPVCAQVVSSVAEEMIKQGEALAQLSERVIVKVPVTREGLRAIHALSSKKISVMASVVFDPGQVLLAARAGASYIAPFFSMICNADQNGIDELKKMVQLIHRYGFPTKMIAASLQSTEHVRECCSLGLDGVTLSEDLFDEYVADHPLTIKTIERFQRDWKKAAPRKKLPM